MTDNIIQLAETIQTASINRHPDHRDINPSTAASHKEPVEFESSPDLSELDAEEAESDEIPISVLRPTPRTSQIPPLPDLRFEQSYLASIQHAESWQRVTFITVKDHIFMPLIQGMVWTLAVAGWRYWNKASAFSGQSVGARIRRWWWKTNNWTLPDLKEKVRDQGLADNVKEYYENEFSSAGGD